MIPGSFRTILAPQRKWLSIFAFGNFRTFNRKIEIQIRDQNMNNVAEMVYHTIAL